MNTVWGGPRSLLLLLVLFLGGSPLALAQVSSNTGLTDNAVFEALNPLEQRAATANQAVYDQLQAGFGCDDVSQDESGSCAGQIFDVYSEVRELVHTANELLGSTGPTNFSLGLDNEGLGFALRWTAAEELAAQQTSTKTFANGQLGSLSSRISALRFHARGPRLASVDDAPLQLMAANEPAGAATGVSIAGKWGIYLDGAFGYGDKDDTTFQNGFEAAFDFDSQEVTLGTDYRLSDSTVLGILVGYTDKSVDFDSSLSVVDGVINSDGGSVMAYALWESERWFATGSIGGQFLSHDLRRRITYPSLNPLVESTDVTALSDTDSTSLLGTLGAGIDFRWGAFTVEPSVQVEYQDITIDSFTEDKAEGFNLRFDEQSIDSLDAALVLKLQYVWTPSFGVVIPFIRGELHREFEDGSRDIRATYVALNGVALDPAFGNPSLVIPTDEVDEQYSIIAGGASMVLPRGWQGFLQYQATVGLDDISESVITGGLRWEF